MSYARWLQCFGHRESCCSEEAYDKAPPTSDRKRCLCWVSKPIKSVVKPISRLLVIPKLHTHQLINTTGTYVCYDFNLKKIFIQEFVREGFGLFPLTCQEKTSYK